MAVRLKDVAERAGVSIKTASNVVNDYIHVSAPTRQRVEAAIAELGYRPNLTARSLRSGRTGVIALALPDLTSPYFAEIARWVVLAAEAKGWTVLVDQTEGVREREMTVLRGIRDSLIDGVIFSPLALGPDDFDSIRPDVPLVCLGERATAGPIDHIAIDNVAAARTATDHLLQRGRHRIAAVGVQDRASAATARLRLEGYREALAAARAGDEVLAAVSSWSRADGARAAAQLMASNTPPDALFCFNDLLAIGALYALAELGIRVPEDVAVVGIDDIEEARYVRPTLTTIAPDKAAISRTAVELLARRIGGEPAGGHGEEVEVPYRLEIRSSA